MNIKIYAIIVTYNGIKWIKKCLDSISESTIKLNIIIVDNASTDNTVEYIKEKYPQVLIIQSQKNLGFGKANNLGIKEALKYNCDYIFLLNQDAYIQKETIEHALVSIEGERNIGIVSLLQLNGDGTDVDFGFMNCIENNTTPGYISDLVLGNKIKNSYISKLGYAAAWLIPKETINIVGGFNPIFNHYGEDQDYCNRLLYHKLNIIFVPSSRVFHDRIGGQGNSKIYNRQYYFRKCLLNVLDINKEWRFFSKENYHLFIEAFSYLFLLSGRYFIDWLNFCFYIIFNSKKIKMNKEYNRSKNLNKWI